MPFQTFDLGQVMQTAEAIKGARRQSTTDALRDQYLGQQISSAEQSRIQQATQFSQEQQVQNTRLLNAAAAEVAQNPAAADRWMPQLQQAGIISPDVDWRSVPPEQLKASAKQLLDSTSASLAALKGPSEGYTLKPGEARYQGDRVVASREANQGEEGFTLGQGQTRFGPDGKPIASVSAAPDQIKQTRLFAQADKLRDEYNAASKDFVAVGDAYQRVLESSADPSAAGDLALIFSYMKILDPGSVVREQEFANAQNAGGVPDRIRSAYNRVLNGERLSENQREDFLGRSRQLYAGQSRRHEKTVVGRYKKLSEDLGVDPKYVVSDYAVDDQNKPADAKQGQSGQAPQIRSDSDYDSLPSGAVFIAPDGSQRRKP